MFTPDDHKEAHFKDLASEVLELPEGHQIVHGIVCALVMDSDGKTSVFWELVGEPTVGEVFGLTEETKLHIFAQAQADASS